MSELDDCWGSVILSFCCEKLVAETGNSSGTYKRGERPLLEAATEQQLVKTGL
jgi:hypothetical protein